MADDPLRVVLEDGTVLTVSLEDSPSSFHEEPHSVWMVFEGTCSWCDYLGDNRWDCLNVIESEETIRSVDILRKKTPVPE